MRLGIYTDYQYVQRADRLYAERAFALFLARFATRLDRMVLIGRLNPDPQRARYEIPPGIEFVPLPNYDKLTDPVPVLRSMAQSGGRFWRALDGLDAVWLLGPHPFALVFALLARLRRRQVFLGVRQETPAYVRRRHPGRRLLHAAGTALDASFAGLARRWPTVVVGPALRKRYAQAPRLLEIAVSLIDDEDVIPVDDARGRPYGGELTILSVGRLEQEKNPLMLADVLARLSSPDGERWRLVVCGEGELAEPLAARLRELGLANRARLTGYVPHGERMQAVYRGSHFLLHTSWTEGLPQVLIEAFAAGLPVVATDVGGIRDAVGDAAVLVPAGDVEMAASALERLAEDPAARGALIEKAVAYAEAHTIEREVGRLAAFFGA